MAKDRAYDPKRRPNIFYKNDPASNNELRYRAYERGDASKRNSEKTLSEDYSETLGYEMGKSEKTKVERPNSGTISPKGKFVNNATVRSPEGVFAVNATLSQVPVDGSALAKGKAVGRNR